VADPATFPEANLLLVAPAGHEDEVGTLPVLRTDGRVVSCWRPSIEELRRIVDTGEILLSIWGGTHPPVLVTGLKEHVIDG
jgi:hypothetical protein